MNTKVFITSKHPDPHYFYIVFLFQTIWQYLMMDEILISTADWIGESDEAWYNQEVVKRDCETSWKHNVCASDLSREGWLQEFAISDVEQ